MNPQFLDYVIYRQGKWLTLFDLIWREGMVIPSVGFVVTIPGQANDFQVTKVRFDTHIQTITVELCELPGTEA